MLTKLLCRRRISRVGRAGSRRGRFRLWTDTRGGVSYIEYIVIIGFIGLAAIGGFKRLRATTWNTVRAQGIAFREIGGAGDIAPVTLAKANVPKMPLPGGGFPSGDGKVHLPVIQPKCFAAGTPVATETGLRPIESITVGERVWARNEQTGDDALARVVQRFITPDSHVIGVDIPIDVARHEVLRVTENHRFYVPDRGWVPARELDGSRLVSIVPRGPPLAGASAIESWGERTTVYNLEVEGLHTYFVGEARVLVHNANEKDKDCTDAEKGLAAQIAWKGFRKGSLAEHYEKHGAEFGNITQNQYLNQAKSFASETGPFQEQKVGNFIVKYDPATRRVLVGHARDREIRTFYIADGRDADPFQAAIEYARELGGG